MNDYFEDIKKTLEKQFGLDPEDIEEDSSLESDLNISDLDMEDLIPLIGEKYQVEIPEEDYSQFKKVADIVNYLYENVEPT